MFFKKNWDKYKDTTPCLIFIPVSEVGINEDISIQQYLSDDGSNELFNDIITGTVNPIKIVVVKKQFYQKNYLLLTYHLYYHD